MAISRIGFIGSRGHWQATLREIAAVPELRVVALADGGDTVIPVEQWCREHGHEARSFDDHRQMLDRAALDAVVVCGPFEQHAAMCVDAIDRDVHVLTEKPAALTFDELDRLSAACASHPLVHLQGMMFSRYDPGFYTAWRLIRDSRVGDVRLINARKSYRVGTRPAYYHDRATYGGTIPWVGSHAIDWTMWFANARADDAPFTSVFATHSALHNAGNGTMERSAACHFTMPGERFATISIDVFRPANAPTHGDDWARIVGTDGVIEARPNAVSLINRENDGTRPVPVACDRQFMRDFIAQAERGEGGLIDTRATLALTDACLRARQSADERQPVSFARQS